MSRERILSIDIFRGLTIFMMVFVNDLAGVKNIPLWMKHAPTLADTMTFVDVVFPAFLFIVGMAIPLAIQNRLDKGENYTQIGLHVLVRVVGLLVLGVFMVNSEEMNAEANLIPRWLWNSLLYISAILIWNQYPPSEDKKKYLFTGLRILGVICLIVLWQLFRKGEQGETGMTTSWWGILGLIGWAYLWSVIVYVACKNQLPVMVGVLAVFIMITVGLKAESLQLPYILSWLSGTSGHFAHTSITLAGVVLTLILQKAPSPGKRIEWMLVMGVLFIIGGFFLRPLYGISKNLATPSWAMYCSAICCLLFPLIYWLVDVKNYRKWATFLKPAGSNPLLTYILPSLFYALIGYRFLPGVFSEGFTGFLRSVLFSLFILGVAAIFTRWKIKLHL